MKIFSLFFLTFLLVAFLEVSSGSPYQRGSSTSSSSGLGQQAQNHDDGNGNRTSQPTGSTPSGSNGSSRSGSRGSPSSGTPLPTPTGSSTRLPQ
ncbi:hypothetical protein Ddc_17868 [Ditylenchus destructor]|nr:hypothetical protein Ddc_17868 [Ditylenchus destructor]